MPASGSTFAHIAVLTIFGSIDSRARQCISDLCACAKHRAIYRQRVPCQVHRQASLTDVGADRHQARRSTTRFDMQGYK